MFNRLIAALRRATTPACETIAPADLQQHLAEHQPVYLLDVRTPAEFKRDGHIAGARLIPLDDLPARLDEVPRDRPVVCVCRSGSRSSRACALLAHEGFAPVLNLRGGMLAWRLARLPVKR